MFEVVSNLARTPNSPGANLPEYIYERMVELEYRPSLRKLGELTGIPAMTLRDNLSGKKEISFRNAVRLSESLNISLDELKNILI